jgi:hypothetical protein
MSRAASARSKETSKKLCAVRWHTTKASKTRALTGRTLFRNVHKSQPLVTFSGGSTEISASRSALAALASALPSTPFFPTGPGERMSVPAILLRFTRIDWLSTLDVERLR